MKRALCRILCLVLALALLAGCSGAPAAAPENGAETPAVQADGATPKLGDSLYGFTVKEIVPMEVLGATGVLYLHEKSGAELLYLQCEDINRSFDISFRTPALNDKGLPHVFEHITISGSQKYPDANLFFPFAANTYNTFVNAMTYHGMTTYPLASLSEEQLMTMMDYYLSGVFQPLLYTEPMLAQREAWRYELSDAEADINIAGTVYSEMQGALTLPTQAVYNNLKTLYAGSTTAYESGGIPDTIRTITYEELLEFHDTYYHPSNALITLYGDLDIARFLEYIDSEYLSKYDKTDIEVDSGRIEPYTETKYASYEVAVESGASTENASEIHYSIALNGADMKDTLTMSTLSTALWQESSPLMKKLREKLPDATISIYTDFDSPSAPYVDFSASGVDPEDRDAFVEAVDEGLEAIATEGISADALEAVLSSYKLSLLTTENDQDLGVDASLGIALGWVYFGSVDYYTSYEEILDELNTESANKYFKRYITDNAHRAVSVTTPVAGLAEQNAEALATELAEKKAAMSDEELAAMVQSSGDYMDWASTPVSSDVLSQLTGIKVAELPEERRQYDVTDETVDGVRYLSAAAEIPGVYSGTIMLDGGAIPVESLQDVQTVMSLLGELDTEKYRKEELSTLVTRYLSDFSAELTADTGLDNKGIYSASLSFTGLTKDAEMACQVLNELLFTTDFSDTALIKSLLTRANSDFKTSLDSSPLSIQLRRCAAMFNDYAAYEEHLRDYDMLTHNLELIALSDSDPSALTARLEAARALVVNSASAVVLSTGSEDGIAAYQTCIRELMGKMPRQEREPVDYSSLRIPAQNEGIIVNSTVQMNCLYSDFDLYSGKSVVTSGLIDDSYLIPQLRNGLGAYGAYSYTDLSSAALYTYRDPNLKNSYDIFAGLPDYLSSTEFSSEAVDRYIIGCYSSLSRPKGLLSDAERALTDLLLGYEADTRLQWMREAKSVTPEDISAAAETWSRIIENAVRSTSGTESTLTAAGELFDVLIYPDGSVKELTSAPAA